MSRFNTNGLLFFCLGRIRHPVREHTENTLGLFVLLVLKVRRYGCREGRRGEWVLRVKDILSPVLFKGRRRGGVSESRV